MVTPMAAPMVASCLWWNVSEMVEREIGRYHPLQANPDSDFMLFRHVTALRACTWITWTNNPLQSGCFFVQDFPKVVSNESKRIPKFANIRCHKSKQENWCTDNAPMSKIVRFVRRLIANTHGDCGTYNDTDTTANSFVFRRLGCQRFGSRPLSCLEKYVLGSYRYSN